MNAAPHSDDELFLLTAHGDEAAFTRLFHKYADQLYHYALKIVHTTYWAEDVVQNLFLQLWQHRDSLVQVDNPRAYLFRIAANRSIDILRNNENKIKLQYELTDIADTTKAEHRVINKQNEELVENAILLLPEKRKLIYRMRSKEGLSYEEISSQLHVSKNTIRNQLAKATATIRRYLVNNDIYLPLFMLAWAGRNFS